MKNLLRTNERPSGCNPLATSPHPAFAKQEPIKRNVFFRRERDLEIRMRSRSVFISVHVLLEHTEVPSELPLRAFPADFGQALGELLLDSFDGGSGHI